MELGDTQRQLLEAVPVSSQTTGQLVNCFYYLMENLQSKAHYHGPVSNKMYSLVSLNKSNKKSQN